uniref:Uncharacterized protein n=1 Tax=Arundo donax TaxID=35708 RepID=A0A0A9DQM6_ARUDO
MDHFPSIPTGISVHGGDQLLLGFGEH